MGNIENTEFYEDVRYCPDATEIESTKIIRYEANIYYANVENFTYQVLKLSSVKPREIIEQIEKKKEESEKRIKKINSKKTKQPTQANTESVASSSKTEIELDEQKQEKKKLQAELDSILNAIKIKHLILDLSSINYIDSMGAESIIKVIQIEFNANANLEI